MGHLELIRWHLANNNIITKHTRGEAVLFIAACYLENKMHASSIGVLHCIKKSRMIIIIMVIIIISLYNSIYIYI